MSNSSSPDSYFLKSVEAVLSNWTALQLAVSQNAAGSNSLAVGMWMAGAVASWFQENKNVEPHEATEMLESILNQEFNVIVEDGSADEIGRLLVDFYSLIYKQKASQEAILERMQSLPKCDLSLCKVEDAGGDQGEDGVESMEVVEPKKTSSRAVNNEPDEDGWITVPTRNKK